MVRELPNARVKDWIGIKRKPMLTKPSIRYTRQNVSLQSFDSTRGFSTGATDCGAVAHMVIYGGA